MAIQIGKYRRPGIFQEEYDKSVITSPIVEGITNMVIGVSKKGPINTPIRLTTTNDLESIFGQLDRGLERKGSFFHRTISKMLETSPVYAINLLTTDDTLDVIEYKSLSSSAGYSNDIVREGPYRRFFNTTGFWKRDTDSFITLTEDNTGYAQRAFSFTNLSDKYITVFVFKTQMTGFDRTLIEWYGSQEKVPPYVGSNDYASDYMVDVVVIGGDWSDYQQLSIDTRWSQYFNASGLIKSQISNFANDRNVTLLAYYEGLSLIPYFRDANGTNIFIETTINRDTDRTGLFCAFNSDLVETDFYNGLLDLVGNTIVETDASSIDFLSYNETIAESIEITATPLDLPGNVTGILGGLAGTFSYTGQSSHVFGGDGTTTTPTQTGIVSNTNRTAWFGEGFVYNVALSATSSASASISVTYNVNTLVAGQPSFAIIGDTYTPVTATTSLTILSSDYPISSTTASYAAAFVLDSTGAITLRESLTSTNPTVDTSDIVLGYTSFNTYNGDIVPTSFSNPTDVNVTTTGFKDFVFGSTNSTDDYYVSTQSTSGSILIEFPNTNTSPVTNNYAQYRRFKLFNRLVDLISSPNKDEMSMCLGPNLLYRKVSLSGMTISNIVTSTTSNKSFVLNTGLTNTELSDVLKGYLVFYTSDNEFILGSYGIGTKEAVAGATHGVVGEYSTFYTNFYDGDICTGDYFYRTFIPSAGGTVSVVFITGEQGAGATSSYAGYDFVLFNGPSVGNTMFSTNDQFIVPDSTLNTETFTYNQSVSGTPTAIATALGYTGYYAFQVVESVTFEELSSISLLYDALNKYYLKMYLDESNILDVSFTDDIWAENPIASPGITFYNTFNIKSLDGNYKQTIEIEVPSGYVQTPNKILIESARYTEVKVGDFLAASYSVPTEIGEVARKLTRIITKRQYSGDTSLVEITCDASILKTDFSGDLQTTRYVSVDNYATTYKAITMEGFRIRTASLPDGTETRQTSILNLVAKGTPLFKAITNKEAIDFRYLIDSFGLGLIERSKQQLVDICGARLDALGIINMPSMKSFKNSSSPSFVDSEGVLQLEYVAKGGDPESSPAFLYSFGDGSGSTSVGYFMPYVTVNDNGRPVDVPPSAYVATTYMRKQNSNVSGITPWTIAAGVTNGRVTNISAIEMDFTSEDIEWINGAQMNPIVFKRNRGNVIETENTAQTLFKSALSYLHVREVLIELERELSRMLLDFQWKFNTPDIRAEIKLRADVICETYVSKSGLYNYFNKMDEENNTSEIIDNQMGVLDTYVEPIKGMGIIVNNITILRTGAISAGGFINS